MILYIVFVCSLIGTNQLPGPMQILSIRPVGTHFSAVLIVIQILSLKKWIETFVCKIWAILIGAKYVKSGDSKLIYWWVSDNALKLRLSCTDSSIYIYIYIFVSWKACVHYSENRQYHTSEFSLMLYRKKAWNIGWIESGEYKMSVLRMNNYWCS